MSSFKDRERGKARRIQVYNYFIQKGYKPHIAASIVGNLMQESSYDLNPSAINKTSGAVGLAQWLGSRKTNLKKYATTKNKSYTDLKTQLEFLDFELQGGKDGWLNKKDKAAFFNSKNVEEATEIFGNKFERAGAHEMNMKKRAKYATKLYLETNDNNIYSKDKKGNIVSVDPNSASPEVIENSPTLQRELHKEELDKIESENKTAEAKLKAHNESEELKRAKREIKNKYNEERFIQSITYGNNNNTQTGTPVESEPEETSEEVTETQEVTQGKDDLLAQTFKPKPQQQVQQPQQQTQGLEMYPGLETTENEFYQSYLPEGFADGGEVDPITGEPIKPNQISLQNLELNNEGDYRFIQELPEITITGKSKDTPMPELNIEPRDLKGENLDSIQKSQETTSINPKNILQLNPEVLNNIEKSNIESIEEAVFTPNLEGPKQDLSKFNKAQIKAVQRDLVTSGDLELQIDSPNANDIAAITDLQVKLKNAGYDLGTYGVNKDGVDGKLGSKTRKALANYNKERTTIDGDLGPITEAAYTQFRDRLEEVKPLDNQPLDNQPLDFTNPVPIQGNVKALKQKFKNQGYNTDVKSNEWDAETAENFIKFKEYIHSNKYPSSLSPLTKTAAVKSGSDSRGNLTEDNFSEDALNLMRRLAVDEDGNIRGGFGYDEARKESGVKGNDVKDIFKNPVHNLTAGIDGVTLNLVLGQAGIISAPDGFTYVYDDYDFNDVNSTDKSLTPEEVYEARLKRVGVDEETPKVERLYQEARAKAAANQRRFELEAKAKGETWRPSATLVKLGRTADLVNPEKQKQYAPRLIKPSTIAAAPLIGMELGVHKVIDYFKDRKSK